jgi:hypothetical protein
VRAVSSVTSRGRHGRVNGVRAAVAVRLRSAGGRGVRGEASGATGPASSG